MLQAASPLPGAGESRLHLSGPSASIRQHQPRSCGLVLLGYSPKPYGSREPFGQLLFRVIDHAASNVRLHRERDISVHCSFELVVGDDRNCRYAIRQQVLLHPASFQLKVHSRIWNPA